MAIFADESFRAVNSELRELPSVELSTLPLMLKVRMIRTTIMIFIFDYATSKYSALYSFVV